MTSVDKSIKRFDIWIADLNPRIGSEPGKIRPVVIIQTDLLNNKHPSTLICPVTTNVENNSNILRIQFQKNESGLKTVSSILIDQIRAIDNRRLKRKIGTLNEKKRTLLEENLKVILDLD